MAGVASVPGVRVTAYYELRGALVDVRLPDATKERLDRTIKAVGE